MYVGQWETLMSTTPVTTEAGKGAEYLQAVRPDHTNQLGSSGATLVVPNAGTAESDPAPFDGMLILGLPVGAQGRVRIGDTVTATANDDLRVGPNSWHFPIFRGERISVFGDGVGFTCSVSMALNR